MLREWKIPLPDGFYILARKDTFLGRWLDFAVVLVRDGECITRYDSEHGFPHRDVLGRKNGLIKKEEHRMLSYKEAFEHAIRDLTSNYLRYYSFFDER